MQKAGHRGILNVRRNDFVAAVPNRRSQIGQGKLWHKKKRLSRNVEQPLL